MMRHKPRKRFGQHFLNDNTVIERFVSLLGLKPDDHVVEIGPGLGALTRPLTEACRQLTLVEIDRDVIGELETICQSHPHCQIHCVDALNFDFSQCVTAGEQLRVVGNLPYNISSPLLFHLLRYAPSIQDMHFMLQKEVVERICAIVGSKNYGRLSVMMQYYCRVTPLFTISPDAFWPPPKVDSAYLRLVPHVEHSVVVEDETLLSDVVRLAFNQRRKTIRNSLKSLLDEKAMESLGINPSARAQVLTVKDFALLANFLYNNPASPK